MHNANGDDVKYDVEKDGNNLLILFIIFYWKCKTDMIHNNQASSGGEFFHEFEYEDWEEVRRKIKQTFKKWIKIVLTCLIMRHDAEFFVFTFCPG